MSYLCFLALDCGTLLAGKSEKLSKHYTLKVFASWERVKFTQFRQKDATMRKATDENWERSCAKVIESSCDHFRSF